jgi:hypothetical protein
MLRLLRSIWKDILWLNSFGPFVRIIGLIFGIALIGGAWYAGAEWWMAPVNLSHTTRWAARLEIIGVVIGVILITYIAYVTDRDRNSR